MWIKHWAVCSSKRKMLKRPDVCFKKTLWAVFFVGCSLRKEIAEDYRAGCSPHNPVPPTFLIAHKIGILYIWAVLPFQRNFALFIFDHLIFKIYNMNFGLQKMKAWIFNHVFLLAFFLGRFWSDGVSQSSPPDMIFVTSSTSSASVKNKFGPGKIVQG